MKKGGSVARIGEVDRKTKETKISLKLNIDGRGKSDISTSIPFLDHMLELMCAHGFFDITLKATGDIKVDYHHTMEDIGICLGEGVKKALGDKGKIKRYGQALLPMDETLACVVLDISNRPHLVYNVNVEARKIGDLDTELMKEFFQGFAIHSGTTLHINILYGQNTHHIFESIFKAFGKALDEATSMDKRIEGPLSTKGIL